MDIKYGHGLEFETEDKRKIKSVEESSKLTEESLAEIMRHGFRTPISASEAISLDIGDSHYAVFNLSPNGVGLYLNKPGEFDDVSNLSKMRLTLDDQSFVIDGVVRHIANDGVHDMCGIELVSVSNECKDAIDRFLLKSRTALFVP